MSHDPFNVTWSFKYTDLLLKKYLLLLSMLKTVVLLNISLMDEVIKQHPFEIEICCNIKNIFKGHCTQSPKCSHVKNKYDLMLCQSCLRTLSMTFAYAFFLYLSSFPIKMLVTDVKTENCTKFFNDGRKFLWQYANVINTIWGRIYFLTCEQFGLRHTPTLYHLFFILQK